MTLTVFPTDQVNDAWITLLSFTAGVNIETHRRFKAYFHGRRKQGLSHVNALKQAKTLAVGNLPEVDFILEGGP